MADDDAAAAFARRVSRHFSVVCFDLDQCAVRRHSRGRLLRTELSAFVDDVSPDFVRAVPALIEQGVRLAITTHSDLGQHCASKPRGDGPNAVVLGDDLVHEVLQRAVPDHAHEFFVVAWRPKSHNAQEMDLGKRRHVRTVAAFYGVSIEDCILFDDDVSNCALTDVSEGRKFQAFRSDPDLGFRFSDFTGCEESPSASRTAGDYFQDRPDGTVDRLGRWKDRWENEYGGKPRFHLDGVNPNLERWYGGAFFSPPLDAPILIPLCGKTVDLKWLSDAGHECVCGVEGASRGIEELRDEILPDLRPSGTGATENPSVTIWTTAADPAGGWFPPDCGSGSGSGGGGRGCISVLCADFFELTPAAFPPREGGPPPFAAIYDRAALVAVPPLSRPDYVAVMDSLLRPGGQILLVTVDPGSGRRRDGPPFPIPPGGILEELFAPYGYSIVLLDRHGADFGGEDSFEYVFLLSKPAAPM